MLGTKIGFDLGTSSTLAYVEGKGITINEPSVIAYDTFTEKVKAIGTEAYKMLGRSPDSLTVVRPIREGNVYDYDAVEQMLCYFIQKICGNRIFKPNVIVCVPSGVSELDKRTVIDLATSSGAARACVVEEPLAAAFGAGVKTKDYMGSMIVNIGAGTTDIAVVTNGCVAVSSSLSVAGNSFDEDICRYVASEFNTVIGSVTAENVKKQVGAAGFLEAELAVRAVGKDKLTNLPKSVEVSSSDVFLSIRENLDRIAEAIRLLLGRTPPELAADVAANGITVMGGGALLKGIDSYIAKQTGVRTVCAENPLLCVANGVGLILKDMNFLEENGYVFKTSMDIKSFEV